MAKSSELRNKLRAATVGGGRNFRGELVEVEGVTLEIREPSVKQRAAILLAGGAGAPDKRPVDFGLMNVVAILGCTYVPRSVESEVITVEHLGPDGQVVPELRERKTHFETGGSELAFEPADRAGLLELPAGSWVDDLGDKIILLMKVDQDAVGKGSEATQTG